MGYTKSYSGHAFFDCGCEYSCYKQQYILRHACVPCAKHTDAHRQIHGVPNNFTNVNLLTRRVSE